MLLWRRAKVAKKKVYRADLLLHDFIHYTRVLNIYYICNVKR